MLTRFPGMVHSDSVTTRIVASGVLRKKSIQAVGKVLFVALAVGGRTTGLHAAGAHRIEEVPHVQASADVFGRVHFAASAERVATLGNHLCCQRNIARYDKIAGRQPAHDFIVGHIESARYLQRLDVR